MLKRNHELVIDLPTVDSSLTNQSNSNWKKWIKAGLIFAGTTGTFLALKATRSFALISSLFKGSVDNEAAEMEGGLAENGLDLAGQQNIAVIDAAKADITERLTDFKELSLNKPKSFTKRDVFPVTGESRVNTYWTNYQRFPSIANLADSKFVIVWQSDGQDGSGAGIYGQMYNADGNTYGNEFQINTYTSGTQRAPSVTRLDNGKFVVTWESYNQDGDGYGVYGQMYNADGSAYSNEFQAHTFTTDYQYYSDVAGLSGGKFVVVWQSDGQNATKGIYGQIYNADRSKYGNEFQVSIEASLHDRCPAVASLGNDKFVAVWHRGIPYNIFGQVFDETGAKIDNEFQVNTYTTSSQTEADVVGLNSGEFVTVWQSDGQDGDLTGIYMSIYDHNIPPVLGNNALTISEGQTVILSGSKLSATDGDDDDATLTFIASSIQNGQFEFVSNPGVPITSFIQQEVTSNNVRFVHNGGENAPAYKISVDDGSANTSPASASISFTNVNDSPVLINNQLTIDEAQTVILTNTNLRATDSDNVDSTLTFTVSNVQNGQFELVSNPGVEIASFIQQEVTSSNLQFVHDGGEDAPTYDVEVSDGSLSTPPASASITFNNVNDTPVLINNSLTINEGQTVVVANTDLSATDSDNDDMTLVFNISNVQYGQFEFVAGPGVEITSFTQQQIVNNEVQFVHDGGENAPTYNVEVSDGSLSSPSAAAVVTFDNNVNDVINNSLTVNEGQTVVVANTDLSATDNDNDDMTLVFNISNVQYGQFEFVASPGVEITSFTQQQIINNEVQFVHDGGENAPTYNVEVSDGSLSSPSSSAVVTFTTISSNSIFLSSELSSITTVSSNILPSSKSSNVASVSSETSNGESGYLSSYSKISSYVSDSVLPDVSPDDSDLTISSGNKLVLSYIFNVASTAFAAILGQTALGFFTRADSKEDKNSKEAKCEVDVTHPHLSDHSGKFFSPCHKESMLSQDIYVVEKPVMGVN